MVSIVMTTKLDDGGWYALARSDHPDLKGDDLHGYGDSEEEAKADCSRQERWALALVDSSEMHGGWIDQLDPH